MNEELQAQYDAAAIPFMNGAGAIEMEHARMRSWRYFLEINSACNLSCPSCTKGNKEGYEHQTGVMEDGMMKEIIAKIAAENPKAIVFLYGNSEPFLHPRLPECIAAVHAAGLRCEMSTNLNRLHRLKEVLSARPEYIIISLSGFTQEVYVKGHHGGNIEKVKANMEEVALYNNLPKEEKVDIAVNYHVYNDNQHEIPLMKEFATKLGIGFFTSYARAISMENALQYLRDKDPHATPYEVQPGKIDYNFALPPVSQTYKDTMARLHIPPDKAREMYEQYPIHKVCPVSAGGMFTFIRHDGKTSLCACVADRRITVGDYLDTSSEQLQEQSRGHPICGQCQKYRMNLYFHIADREKWISPI